MDPTIQSALIGFGGVIIGSVLLIVPQYFGDKRERAEKKRIAHQEHLRYILQQLLPLGPVFFKNDDEGEYIKTIAYVMALIYATGDPEFIEMSVMLQNGPDTARSFFYHVLKKIGTELANPS